MSKLDLIPLLSSVIRNVFDNEEQFMRDVYRPNDGWGGELIEFYMASEFCRLTIILPCGQHVTDRVKTSDVLDWTSDLAKAKGDNQ